MGFGSAFGSALGGLSSAAGSGMAAAAPLLGQYFGNKLNYRFAKKTAIHGPSWQVKGLRRAGLNPILAVSSGFKPNQMSSSSIDPTAAISNISSSKQARQQTRLLTDQTRIASAKAKREEMINDVWKSSVGRTHIVPMAAASAAGVKAKSVADAVLLPSLINSANSAKDSKSLFDRYKESWSQGRDALIEIHSDAVKRSQK